MGFWIFMLVCCTMIPAMMIVIGRWFMQGGPKERNMLFGYRTKRSMQSQEAWVFAHHFCGKLWLWIGAVLVPMTIAAMVFVYGKTEDTIGTTGMVLVTIQILAMIVTITATEHALKNQFRDDRQDA